MLHLRRFCVTATAALLVTSLLLGGACTRSKRITGMQKSRPDFAEAERPADVKTSDARKLVYLVDLTDKPSGAADVMLDRLKGTIDSLSEVHAFTVLFLNGNEAVEIPPYGLKFATEQVKSDVAAWIESNRQSQEIRPTIGVDATQALELARWYHPHQLYILTTDLRRTIEGDHFKVIPSKAETRVNVVQYYNQDEKSVAWVRYVTREHRGTWRFLTREQLDPTPAAEEDTSADAVSEAGSGPAEGVEPAPAP